MMKNTLPTTRLAKFRRALTLLELVMVVSILAVLTAMVVPSMTNQQEETRMTVARTSLSDLRNTIANRYLQDLNDLPRGSAVEASSRASETVSSASRCMPQLHFLFVNPNTYQTTTTPPYLAINDYDQTTRVGWNGPYSMASMSKYPVSTDKRLTKNLNDTRTWADFGFTSTYGNVGDHAQLDPWGSPFVIVTKDHTHGTAAVRSEYVVSAGPNLKLDIADWVFTNGTLDSKDDLALLIRTIADPNP